MHLFRGRSNNVDQRRRYVRMVESVREQGGEALIFSSMHESGQRESSHAKSHRIGRGIRDVDR